MEEQIFVAVCVGFFGLLLITVPIFRLYLIEKKENDSRKEQERFDRYCRKRGINPDEPKCSPLTYDENLGHMSKDRSNISDVIQGDRPIFTSIGARIKWDLENNSDIPFTYIGRHKIHKRGIFILCGNHQTWLTHSGLNEHVGKEIPLYQSGDKYYFIHDNGEVITMKPDPMDQSSS